jgi:hypothetical protein
VDRIDWLASCAEESSWPVCAAEKEERYPGGRDGVFLHQLLDVSAAWCRCCLMSVLLDVGEEAKFVSLFFLCGGSGRRKGTSKGASKRAVTKVIVADVRRWSWPNVRRWSAKKRSVGRSGERSGDEGDRGERAEVIVTKRTEVIGEEKERRKERWKEQWRKRVEVIETKVRKANVAKPDEGENEPLKLQKTAAETPFSFLGCFKQKRRRICNVSQWNGTYFKGLLCCKPLIFRRDINLFVGRRGGGGAHGGSRGCYVVSPKFP